MMSNPFAKRTIERPFERLGGTPALRERSRARKTCNISCIKRRMGFAGFEAGALDLDA
jgi:hypothetical protein